MTESPATRTVILGGGIAGLEALLALKDLAGERTEVTLAAPEPDFTYKPRTVEEPFNFKPAEHRELEPLVAELGGKFIRGAVRAVDLEAHEVEISGGIQVRYDFVVVCVGGHARGALTNATTFRVAGEPLDIDSHIDRALEHSSKRLAFVVPPGVSWSLPIYELALMTRRRAEEHDRHDLRLVIVTPESTPLSLFGTVPSETVAELLGARGVEFEGGVRASDEGDGIVLIPGHRPLDAGAAIALPAIEGRQIPGLPSDESGFIPIDEHARVVGVDDAYAAGDGTNFPIKQGGLATQQADAAAAHIAARLGADVDAELFHPVLRGQLIVGVESLNLRHDVTGGHGEGTASPDYLWWPPHKVSGRYLAPWLAKSGPHADPAPPEHSIDVELAFPTDWFEQPMTLDPN